jgi:hypothetical protein
MADDFLDQLAELDVPPPPAGFDSQLHGRVNRTLLLQQMVELMCEAIPLMVVEFGRAMRGALRFTLTGKYESSRRKRFH